LLAKAIAILNRHGQIFTKDKVFEDKSIEDGKSPRFV
jgi:hypothetical protein